VFFSQNINERKPIFFHATSADQNQLSLLCRLAMVCHVRFSVSVRFEIFPKMVNGFVQIKRKQK
jgi:hypothetical protein